MNEREAIKYIEQHGFIADDVKDMAIKAINKQFPKKVEAEEDAIAENAHEVCMMCPSCGEFVGYAVDLEDENYQPNYCKYCGQSLDWGE